MTLAISLFFWNKLQTNAGASPSNPIPFKRLSDNTCGKVTVPPNSKWCFFYHCTVASEPVFIFTKEPQAATKLTIKTNKRKKKSAGVFFLQIHPAVMRPILNNKERKCCKANYIKKNLK